MSTPTTDDTITRVLSLCPRVHIYNLPPLTSNKGYQASTWTSDPSRQIFTARLRVLETATPTPTGETIAIKILLEDPKSAELFAEAPYTAPGVVEPAQDSSRFFAVRVVGDGGMKATLGMGFEDRSDAVDFGICLQEARKVLGFEGEKAVGRGKGLDGGEEEKKKKDWSLKEGETIKIDVGGRGRRKAESGGGGEAKAALFSIKPPPGGAGVTGAIPLLAPPPSASEARAEKRRSREGVVVMKKNEAEAAAAAGFDDGEFGEFQ